MLWAKRRLGAVCREAATRGMPRDYDHLFVSKFGDSPPNRSRSSLVLCGPPPVRVAPTGRLPLHYPGHAFDTLALPERLAQTGCRRWSEQGAHRCLSSRQLCLLMVQ